MHLLSLLLALAIGFMPMQVAIADLHGHGEQKVGEMQMSCHDDANKTAVDHGHQAHADMADDHHDQADEPCTCCYGQGCDAAICLNTCSGAHGGTLIPAHSSNLYNSAPNTLVAAHLLAKRERSISPPQRPPRTISL